MTQRNSVLIVTGGGRGIGKATSLLAAQQGYDVVIGYRSDAEAAQATAEGVRAQGRRAIAAKVDVRDPEAVANLFERTVNELGAPDALVNSAGITGRAAPILSSHPGVMREVLDTNVLGTLLCCREAARRMALSRGGSGGAIVNLSSGAATLGSPGEYVWYAASKGAVDTLTIGLSKELAGEGIRVNAVSPGLTETELHARSTGEPGRVARMAPDIPLQRGAQPGEIAAPILWLLSDAASYTTGAILRVAGGR